MGLSLRTIFSISLAILLIFEGSACRRPNDATDVNTITLYGFSVMEEPLEKSDLSSVSERMAGAYGQADQIRLIVCRIGNGDEPDCFRRTRRRCYRSD